jgi:hypothetical protein
MARKVPPPVQDHGLAPEGVRSVERCIDILDLLVAQEREMTLSELATAIGAPKSTTLTVVRTRSRASCLHKPGKALVLQYKYSQCPPQHLLATMYDLASMTHSSSHSALAQTPTHLRSGTLAKQKTQD